MALRVFFAEDIENVVVGELSLVLTLALLAPGLNMDSLRGVLASKRAIVEAVGGSWHDVLTRVGVGNDLMVLLIGDLQQMPISIELENAHA